MTLYLDGVAYTKQQLCRRCHAKTQRLDLVYATTSRQCSKDLPNVCGQIDETQKTRCICKSLWMKLHRRALEFLPLRQRNAAHVWLLRYSVKIERQRHANT